MISNQELVELQLQSAYGEMLSPQIKSLVDRELEEGNWVDGYEIAGFTKDIDREESLKLLEVVLNKYAKERIDLLRLDSVIESELPQRTLAKLTWLVSMDSSFVMTDSLRVARFRIQDLLWRTPRISWDGIKLKEIRGKKVFGYSWLGGRGYGPNQEFVLDYESGELLDGDTYPSYYA